MDVRVVEMYRRGVTIRSGGSRERAEREVLKLLTDE